jgi:hypothetical protein
MQTFVLSLCLVLRQMEYEEVKLESTMAQCIADADDWGARASAWAARNQLQTTATSTCNPWNHPEESRRDIWYLPTGERLDKSADMVGHSCHSDGL